MYIWVYLCVCIFVLYHLQCLNKISTEIKNNNKVKQFTEFLLLECSIKPIKSKKILFSPCLRDCAWLDQSFKYRYNCSLDPEICTNVIHLYCEMFKTFFKELKKTSDHQTISNFTTLSLKLKSYYILTAINTTLTKNFQWKKIWVK